MYPLVEDYYASSLSKLEFCKQNEIKESTLSYWVTKYRRDQDHDSGNFVKLEIEPVRGRGNIWMELELSSGAMLRFHEPVAPDYVRSLLQGE